MEIPHSDVLKKLEGRKDRKGYIQILSEGQMSVADYFTKSFYIIAILGRKNMKKHFIFSVLWQLVIQSIWKH